MITELTFWDYVTLVVAILIVVVYTIIKIRAMLKPTSGGCSGCSTGGCNVSATNQNKTSFHTISISSIKNNVRE